MSEYISCYIYNNNNNNNKGYPTIKFFPAKDKKALVFEEKHITAAGSSIDYYCDSLGLSFIYRLSCFVCLALVVLALIHFMEDKAVNYKAPSMRRTGDVRVSCCCS